MAETNTLPTEAEVSLIRADLKELLPDYRTLADEMAEGLLEVKRVLEDERKVVWSRVYNTADDAYFDNSDSTGRNKDRIQNAISHMTAAIIFQGYSVMNNPEEEQWASLAQYHRDMAKSRLLDSTLDIDSDDSGAIGEGEEGQTGQVFMVK